MQKRSRKRNRGLPKYPTRPPPTPPLEAVKAPAAEAPEPEGMCAEDLRVWRMLPSASKNMLTRDEWAALSPDERQRRREYQEFLDQTRRYMKAQTEHQSRSRIAEGVNHWNI